MPLKVYMLLTAFLKILKIFIYIIPQIMQFFNPCNNFLLKEQYTVAYDISL